MKVNLNKKKITKVILDYAFKFPLLFPKHIQWHAKHHHSNSKQTNRYKKENSIDRKVSLLDNEPHWKSISFSFIFNDSELKKLDKWKIKKSIYLGENEFNYNLNIKQFDNNFWSNIGTININKDSFIDNMNSLYIESPYLNSVAISLSCFSLGLSLVTFYIYLNPCATNLISNVKPPKMTEFVELESINIFNKKRKGLRINTINNYEKNYLENNIKIIFNDAWKLTSHLLNEMKVNKKKEESHNIVDMYIDKKPPYFNDKIESDNNHHIIINKKQKFTNFNISGEIYDSFILNNYHSIKDIDIIYIKTQPQAEYENHNNFKNMYCSNYDSHLYISIFFLIDKKISLLSNSITKINPFDSKKKLPKLHENLFEIMYEFKIINSWLNTLKNNDHYHKSPEYKKSLNKITDKMINRVNTLHKTTNSIYSLSENRIQITNIKYNQRYSILIFILVITQIILAAMTIKWSDNNAWYTQYIIWIKDMTEIIF